MKRELNTVNRNLNDWKLQLHCNKLHWVNTGSMFFKKTLLNFFKINND